MKALQVLQQRGDMVRFLVVKKPRLLKRLEVRRSWQRREARRHGATGGLTGGGACFWQWFGSQLQLTPHLHLLVPEALWQGDGRVVAVAPPGDEDVARVLARVLREAKKDWADLEAAWPEDEYEYELLQQAQAPAATPSTSSAGAGPETEAAAPRLGAASPADVWHRRAALPLWRPTHHQEPLLDPQARRGASHRARRRAPLASASSHHRATPVASRDVKETRFTPTSAVASRVCPPTFATG